MGRLISQAALDDLNAAAEWLRAPEPHPYGGGTAAVVTAVICEGFGYSPEEVEALDPQALAALIEDAEAWIDEFCRTDSGETDLKPVLRNILISRHMRRYA